MSTVSLTGNDSINIGGRVFADFGDGDIATLTYDNDLVDVKAGKNGNTLYAQNATGNQATLVLRIIRGSSDDKYLNGLLALLRLNFAGFILQEAQLVKRVGNGLGFISNDTYIAIGGIPSKNVDFTSNVEGNTDQSLAIYTFKFGNVFRATL